jgi:O-Antigen ligase
MSLKTFFNAVSFSIILFGYALVAVLVSGIGQSQALTIPYRILVLSISFYFIYIKFFKKNNDLIEKFLDSKTYFKSRETIRIFPLVAVFCVMYSFRFFNDVYGKKLYFGNDQYYFSFLFLISWIPSISFLTIDMSKPKEYLHIAQLTLISFGLLMLSRLSVLQASIAYTAQGRLSSEALNPISLGYYSGSLILISVYIILKSKDNSNILLTRILPFASLPLGLYFLLAAASRGPLLSTIICLMIMFISSGKKLLYVGIPSVMIGFYLIVDFILPLLGKGGSNLDRLVSTNDPSAESRGDLVSISLQKFGENWHNTFFGYGVELPKYGYPHNIVVESFLSTGIVGGCIFSLICLVVLLRAVDLVMCRDPWSWVGIFYIQVFIMALVSGSIYAASAFWYLLFAVNVLWNKKDYANVYRKIHQQYFQNP